MAKKPKCHNCGKSDGGMVYVAIPCPSCRGGSVNEIDALRALAMWCRKNTEGRSKPAADMVRLLNDVARAQGKVNLFGRPLNNDVNVAIDEIKKRGKVPKSQ